MTIKNIFIVGFVFFLAACTMVIPTWTYRAPFNPDKSEEVIAIMRDIAHEWKLQFSVDAGDNLRVLTDGKKAFSAFLYIDEPSIVYIGNIGHGNSLTMMVADTGDIPIEELNRLKADIINTLEKRAGIEFELYSKPKSDEPYLTF